MDSKAQQDNSNMQIQSPGTEIGQHHREAIRENELRRICLCVEIGFELRMSSGSEFQTVGASKAKLKPNCLGGLVNCRLKFWYIKEIGNTLTTSSFVSSVVCG